MDKSMQRFEEFAANEGLSLEIFNGDYNWLNTRIAWTFWQASRESLEIELPEYPDKSDPFYDDVDIGISLGVDQVKKVLITNGVKVK